VKLRGRLVRCLIVLCQESVILLENMSSADAKDKESKRQQTRYAVSDDCRVKASIVLRSSDEATANKDWPGTLVDVSTTGAHIQISLAAVAYQGDSCVLKLAHGGRKAEVRGILAHYICSARYSMCGVRFDIASAGLDKNYEAFLKAIMASTTLKAGETGTEPGRYREEYQGPGHLKLVVWRDNKPERTVVAFDYAMTRYSAALSAAGPDMFKNKEQVVFRAVKGGDLTREQEAEARWEFSLAASNLPKEIAADIRRLLRLVS
jgi:hypothetical protein